MCIRDRDTAAAAHVQKAFAAVDVLLQRLQHQPGGVVAAGAERHTRIDGQHLPSAGISGFLPGGTDQQPLSYRQGLEVLFPAVGPVILLHLPVLQFMADALRCQPFPQRGRGFRRIVLRADVQMKDVYKRQVWAVAVIGGLIVVFVGSSIGLSVYESKRKRTNPTDDGGKGEKK